MQDTFGCADCWPDAAEAAWQARRAMTCVAELVDESHFHVMILACPSCAQRFVSVFTETIDWHAGDDAQFWSLLPITAPEEARLVEQQSSVTENALDELGPGRRCLRVDHPSGGEKEIYWGTGLFVLFHD